MSRRWPRRRCRRCGGLGWVPTEVGDPGNSTEQPTPVKTCPDCRGRFKPRVSGGE